MSACIPGLVLALAAAAAPAPDDPPVYRWKFEKDKTFYQEMTTETNQTLKVMGQEVVQSQKQTLYFSWTPIRQEGANWVIQQKIEGVKMQIDIGGNKVEYDSTRSVWGKDPLTNFLRALVGSAITLTLDRDMKVTKIEGREQFVNQLVKADPRMQPLLVMILSEEACKDMVNSSFSALPTRPVEKGESWARTSGLDMGPIGRYRVTYEYVFHGKDDRMARFQVDNIHFKYLPPENNAGGLPFVINQANLQGKKGNGTLWFDIDKGRFDRSEMFVEIEGQMDISIGGQNTTIELRQVQKTTMRTTDAHPFKK